jgi:26S proteasome regulatory subunit N5|tara:strand:+ start:2796 stop:4121 length:1326 start_codon:yes stop_codon:yes gene_type:complete
MGFPEETRARESVSYASEIASAKALAASGSLEGALQNLLGYEKTARLAADVGATIQLTTAMVEMCHDAKDWTQLNETMMMLSKRRAQLKQAVTAMVQLACTYLDELETETLKLALIETLRSISEGKMYVEVERARLTQKLAVMQEAKGELETACKLMQDTAVEALGGMDRREKTDFILEQVRLCLDTKDFIRAHIMAKKIQIKIFKDVELEDLKMRYYKLIVRYHTHSHNWMEMFRAYQAMFDSPALKEDTAAAERCLKLQLIYLVLSPFDNEQSDQMHALAKLKSQLEKLPMYKQLLQLFITKEIFHFADCKPGLQAELAAFGHIDAAEQELMLETMHTRVTQHNIQAVACYYARISIARLANLLALAPDAMEKELCAMVSNKQVYARIDRPAGVIKFSPPKAPNELLNDWSTDISQLLTLLEGSCHLIHKENVIHKIPC